jgi:hypothetical protein
MKRDGVFTRNADPAKILESLKLVELGDLSELTNLGVMVP